jgi:hypothetical protein
VDLRRLIGDMLTKDPSRRPSIGHIMGREIVQVECAERFAAVVLPVDVATCATPSSHSAASLAASGTAQSSPVRHEFMPCPPPCTYVSLLSSM